MKIALISASPKRKGSASQCILQDLRACLGDTHTVEEYAVLSPNPPRETLEAIAGCNALVFAFPLYVDGVPSHLLGALAVLEEMFGGQLEKEKSVYAIVNCGFYEGKQAAVALRVMQNWCVHAGLRWGQGLGVGAGGMLPMLESVPSGHGPKKNLGRELGCFAQCIVSGGQADTVFITANFPRVAYKTAAEYGWRRMAKENGVRSLK